MAAARGADDRLDALRSKLKQVASLLNASTVEAGAQCGKAAYDAWLAQCLASRLHAMTFSPVRRVRLAPALGPGSAHRPLGLCPAVTVNRTLAGTTPLHHNTSQLERTLVFFMRQALKERRHGEKKAAAAYPATNPLTH